MKWNILGVCLVEMVNMRWMQKGILFSLTILLEIQHKARLDY